MKYRNHARAARRAQRAICLLAALSLLLLLCGCTEKRTPGEANTKDPADMPPETISGEQETGGADGLCHVRLIGGADGFTEGTEDEFRQEYPVAGFRCEPDCFATSGALCLYRYEQVDAAAQLAEMVADYFDTELFKDEDSAHDGYANWFSEQQAPRQVALSGSEITGKFCVSVNPEAETLERLVKDYESYDISDCEPVMTAAAAEFVQCFEPITGALTLLKYEPTDLYFSGEASDGGWLSYEAVGYRYYFVGANSDTQVLAQDGLRCPVLCGDSAMTEPQKQCFCVSVLPDGTVMAGDNYLTCAALRPVGETAMMREDELQSITEYFTSFAEDDTIVFTRIQVEHYDHYFGAAEVEPCITVEYYFESDPTQRQSTQMMLSILPRVVHDPAKIDSE